MQAQSELTKIAAERSPEKRLELLHKVMDLYLDNDSDHSPAEAYLFNDIMERIVEQFSNDLKRQVSANLAVLPAFPARIVQSFAENDDIEVARPVLRNASSLTEDDLVHLAKRGSQEHLAAIAGRTSVPEAVTDVLLDRGDVGVVHAVTANHGARFSESGMDRLLDRCGDDIDLRELLVERPDLSAKTVDKLIPMVSESLLYKLAERGYEVSGAVPADMVKSLRQRFLSALTLRKENILQVSIVIEEVRKGARNLDEAVRQIAEHQRLLDVATVLATFARLDKDQVFNMIYKGQLQTILILCRSLDLSWGTLDTILAVRAVKQKASYYSDLTVRRDYEAVDLPTAQRAIRFLRVRQIATLQAERAPAQAGAA